MSLEDLELEDPRLGATVRAAAEAVAEEHDVCAANLCMDLSHAAAETLRDAGYPAVMICSPPRALGLRAPEGHCWARAGDWNVDLAMGQFEEGAWLPYPFVTRRDDPEALRIYGPGSEGPGPAYDVDPPERRRYFPSVEELSVPRSLRELDRLERATSWTDVRALYRTLQAFRRRMRGLGLMERPVPPLRLRVPRGAGEAGP